MKRSRRGEGGEQERSTSKQEERGIELFKVRLPKEDKRKSNGKAHRNLRKSKKDIKIDAKGIIVC